MSILKKIKYLYLFILLFILNQEIFAQEKDKTFSEIVEKIHARKLQSESLEVLQEKLWFAYNNPIDLNNISNKILRDLGILSENQIKFLFQHINEFGYLLSINELQIIPEFDEETIRLLKNFVKVIIKSKNKPILEQTKNSYSLIRYKNNLENNEKKNIGSNDTIFIKAKIQIPKKFKLGFTGNKKPGEKFIWDHKTNRYYFNSYSASIEFENIGFIKSIVLGDYRFGCGQGIISSDKFLKNKTRDILYIPKIQKGLTSFQATKKNTIFRGIASTLSYNNIEFSLLFSRLNRDASIESDADQLSANLASNDLIYNTKTNLLKKNNLLEHIAGFCFLHKIKNTSETGFTFLHSIFDPPLTNKKNRNDYEYLLKGKNNSNFSCFGKYFIKNVCLFSEAAISISDKSNEYLDKDNFGIIIGSLIAINKKLDIGISARYYGPHFHSIRGNPIKQSSSEPRNEKAIFLTTKLKPVSNITIDSFLDAFWFPKEKYKISKPSEGIEFGSKIQFSPNKKHLIEMKFKNKNKDIEQNNMILRQNIFRSSIKYNWKINTKLKIKILFSANNHNLNQKSKLSVMTLQELQYKITKITLKGGTAFFNAGTKTEESLYVYESKPLYEAPIPVRYTNQGQKGYFLVCYKPYNPIRIEFKYEIIRYNDILKFDLYKYKNIFTLQLIFKY